MLHLPLKIVQRLDMPQAFAGDGAEDQGAEEIHKKDFRDTELQSLLKSFQRPATAPAVDGGQGVAGQGYHILYRDRIRVFAQQLFIVAVHLSDGVLGQLLRESRHIVGAVPALRRRVEFRENRPFLQICFHILFSDFIAPVHKRLEIMMSPEGRGFESHRLRQKKHRSSVRITVLFLLNINSRGVL
jgi:hypothetical protein